MFPINALSSQWTYLGGEKWRSPGGQVFSGKAPTSTTFAGNYKVLPKFNPEEWQRMQQRAGEIKGSTGAVSTQAIKGTLTQTIPKATAMGKIFSKVKAVGSLAARNHPIGRALIGYEILKQLLEQQGYEYDEQKQGFIDTRHEYVVVYKVTVYEPQYKWIDFNQFGILKETYKMGYEKGWRALADQACKADKSSYSAKLWLEKGYTSVGAHPTTPGCVYENNGDTRNTGAFEIKPNPHFVMTEQQFAEIVAQEVESNLQKYLDPITGELQWSEPKIHLLPGQIAQSDPYTNPETGQPEQVRWKVVDDSNAPGERSIIQEEIIPRSDLTPNSPEAPKIDSNSIPKDNIGSNTGGNTGTKTGNEEQRPPSDTEDLCEKHPNILACDKLPDDKPGASEPAFVIPEETVNLQFTPDSIFPDNGTCPAPVNFDVSIPFSGSQTFALTYDYVCDVAAKLRTLLIAVAWLVVAFFATRALRNI